MIRSSNDVGLANNKILVSLSYRVWVQEPIYFELGATDMRDRDGRTLWAACFSETKKPRSPEPGAVHFSTRIKLPMLSIVLA